MPLRGFRVGPNGETYNPTIRAPDDINVEEDCVTLRDAMKGLGTDEEKIVEILGHRTQEQRLKIREQFKAMYGEDLLEKVGKELSGDFKELVHMLLSTWSMVNAKALYKCIKGGGTDESSIVEILCTASNDEIAEMKDGYKELLAEEGESDPSRTLEKDLVNDLGGDFKRFIVALLQGCRNEITDEQAQEMRHEGIRSVIDMDAVNQDVIDLYDAGAGRLGTDEAQFIRIMSTRNIWHLQAVANLYEQKTGKLLIDAIESETSGDFKDALKLTLFTCLSRIRAYSELLRHAMAGLGTKDSTLMRIIVTRCEVDLKDIGRQFEADQGQSLVQWIRDDTSGDYRKLLVALLGEEWKE